MGVGVPRWVEADGMFGEFWVVLLAETTSGTSLEPAGASQVVRTRCCRRRRLYDDHSAKSTP